MPNEMWTATYVIIVDDEISAFGNLGGIIYKSPQDAWNAILNDLEEFKNTNPIKGNAFIDEKHMKVTYNLQHAFGHFTQVCWKPQKMVMTEIE